jgi:hypothetical protein
MIKNLILILVLTLSTMSGVAWSQISEDTLTLSEDKVILTQREFLQAVTDDLRKIGREDTAKNLSKYIAEGRVTFGKDTPGQDAWVVGSITGSSSNALGINQELAKNWGSFKELATKDNGKYDTNKKIIHNMQRSIRSMAILMIHENIHMGQYLPDEVPEYENPAYEKQISEVRRVIKEDMQKIQEIHDRGANRPGDQDKLNEFIEDLKISIEAYKEGTQAIEQEVIAPGIVDRERFKTTIEDMNKLVKEVEDLIKSVGIGKDPNMKKPAYQGLARVLATSGGDSLINRGNISGRDPLGFLNCLCKSFVAIGVYAAYDPRPSSASPSCADPSNGDCIGGNWGCFRNKIPEISDLKNNSCAASYGITEMRTNKTPLQPIAPGALLNNGDQIQTTGKAVLPMADGSRLLANPNSVLTFTKQSSGKILVDIQQGGARIISSPGGASNVEVSIGDKKIRPKGTEYTAQWDGTTGNVAVIEGSVTLTNETSPANESSLTNTNASAIEPEVSLQAGWQLETPSGKISPYNLSADDGGMFVGLPLRDLILDDSDQEPYGENKASFADGKIPKGWIWQDPGNDAKIETPENGTLKVTVPDGNDLWGQRTDAPRLLHKVTGDFDLEGELLLKSNGTNYAVTQFVLYSPGSNLGILTNQMDTNGLAKDYWVGGGWLKQSGINKLPLLNKKDLKDCPNAPDSPVKLKITRHEDIVKTYWSQDGRHWNLSSRDKFNISDTIWVGWVFKRMANDGLTSEPAVNTLKGVKLVTAPLGSMEVPEWDVVPGFGEALAENNSIRLALNGTTLGDVAAETGARFAGDLDAVVHFDTSNWTGQDGVFRAICLFASNGDDKNYTNIANVQIGTQPQRYQTDLGINKVYGRYNGIKTSDLQGYLRIVRHNGNFSTYYWSECQWVPLGEFKTGFTDPVYIGVSIANSDQAKKPVPLAVDFNVEQILAGEAINRNWTPPTYCSLIQPVPLPTVITLPQGVEAKMFKPAFALGTIFFGPDGTAYAFSSEKGKQKLMAIDGTGTARTYAESEVLAGINRKTGVMLGSSVLMTVDGWADGGNRYSGIFELDPNGTFSQWNLKSSYGGMVDIISAPDGGWYFSDFESDNIWHLPGRAAAEEPRITVGDSSSRVGLIQLAYDSADGTLYALDNYLDFRNAGTFRVCKITPDGEVVPVANINETSKMNGGMALSSSGPLGHALYVSDAAAGKILKLDVGTTEPVITGLTKPGEMQFNPLNGDLLIVCDEGKSLLWVGSNLSGVGTGRSLGLQQGSSQWQPSGMANGSMQGGCHTDSVTGREICVYPNAMTPFTFVNESNNRPEKNVQGGCHKDPVTGQTICINTNGDLSGNAGTHVTIKPGSIWKVKEYGPVGNWDGEWVVREDAQTIDASWSGGSITDIIDIKSMQGDQITLYRHGNKGYYTGTLTPDGLSMSGTASWYSPGETWTATVNVNDTLGKVDKPEKKAFQFSGWGDYKAIDSQGGTYFEGYDNGYLYTVSDAKALPNDQAALVLKDSGTEQKISTNSPLILGDGFELRIMSIDTTGKKVYLELHENDQVVDSKVVQPSSDQMFYQTYYYKVDLGLGDTKRIIQIAVHFKDAQRENDVNTAAVDGVWQISAKTSAITSLQEQNNEYQGTPPASPSSSGLGNSLVGDWIMEGRQTGVENSDWAAKLTLKSDGTLSWLETEGATPGATRTGTWDYDGTTIILKWAAPKGGQTAWVSTSVKDNSIEDGAYTAEKAPAGVWSASRSGSSGNGQMARLQGDWRMAGRTTGVQNSDWVATLTLNSDGTLAWRETEGATIGASRTGTWVFDGTTITLRWMAPKGDQTVWTSAYVTDPEITNGAYSAENVQGGTWSARKLTII